MSLISRSAKLDVSHPKHIDLANLDVVHPKHHNLANIVLRLS